MIARRRPPAASLAGAALTLVACGSQGAAPHCTPRPSSAPPVVASGPFSATADSAVVPLGATAHLAVRVTGPATYQAPCEGPVRMIVVDSADLHLYSDAPAAPRGTPCGAVTLAAGQRAEYDLAWPVDPTLPAGAYRVVLTLGDQPDLVVPLRLGAEDRSCFVPVSGGR